MSWLLGYHLLATLVVLAAARWDRAWEPEEGA